MSDSAAKSVTFGEGKTYLLDDFGFLYPPEQWDEDFANGMARLQGIHDGLTEEHWKFISYIREKFLVEKTLPLLVVACVDNNIRLGKLKSLFPTGYFRGACRIAGVGYQFVCDVNIWHTYESVDRLPPEHEITSQGFLEDFDQWNERFAKIASAEWQLPHGLIDKHWDVIHFLRNYYLTMNSIPTVYEVCEAHALDLDDFYALFPPGYRFGACLIAGLPFVA